MSEQDLLIVDLLYRFGFTTDIRPGMTLRRIRDVLQQADINEEYFMVSGGDCVTLCLLESYNHLEVVKPDCYRLTPLGKATLKELETLEL